jgi:hypothetical protein
MSARRALLTGHFSTVGDIESLDIVREWMIELGIEFDVAPFAKSVRSRMDGVLDLADVDPTSYRYLVMICGPVWREQLDELELDLGAFEHCLRIGVNLTMVEEVGSWNPFDILLERDSDRLTRPDLTLLGEPAETQVVGRCMVKNQNSYLDRQRHDEARAIFDEAIGRHDFAAIDIDTRWYRDVNGIRSPAHLVAALRRVDLLFTNRLHGMVYALKAGVPVVAIDAIAGGAKVAAQAEVLGWPQCIPIEEATAERLDEAVAWCLSREGRVAAAACRAVALPALEELKQEFFAAVDGDGGE